MDEEETRLFCDNVVGVVEEKLFIRANVSAFVRVIRFARDCDVEKILARLSEFGFLVRREVLEVYADVTPETAKSIDTHPMAVIETGNVRRRWWR